MHIKKKLTTVALAIIMLFSTNLFALDLSEAKSQGLVGETYTGYLGAVKPSPSVNELVSSINTKRKSYYQAISTKNGTTLSTVEKLAGEKLIKRAPAGQYVDTGSGWKKK